MTRKSTVRISAKPSLNYQDAPEVALIGGSGPLSRRVGYRSDRTKFRVRSLDQGIDDESLVLPVLAENTDEDAWFCLACTFANHGELKECEMCGTPANHRPVEASWEHVPALGDTEVLKDDWPSLHEATHSFVDCEISSLGSWLDIGNEESTVLDESCVVVVNPAEQRSVGSWAARAKAVASQGPAASVPAAGFVAPSQQVLQSKKHKDVQEASISDVDDSVLDCLEERRLCPRLPRSSQRRRSGRGGF